MQFYRATLVYIFFLLASHSISYATENSQVNIHLLTHEMIMEANVETDDLMNWSKTLVETAQQIAATDKESRDIAILVTVHKDKPASVTVCAKPKSPSIITDAYQKELEKINFSNSKYCDFSILFVLNINGGCLQQESEFSPNLPIPDKISRQDFAASDLKKKKELLQAWATKDVIPLLGHYTSSVDTQFEGVLGIGKILLSHEFIQNKSVEELTDKNSLYWRAVVEMSGGNQLIPASKIFMYVANGQFDIARRYLQVIQFFCDQESLATYYLSELNWRFTDFYNALGESIQTGIQFHDKGEYSKAIQQYQQVLAVYPKSAWANYELFYSENALHKESVPWAQAKKVIYACDPLYPTNVHASTGREGYLLFRRKEIESLFQDNQYVKRDLIQYADIASIWSNMVLPLSYIGLLSAILKNRTRLTETCWPTSFIVLTNLEIH